LLHNTVFLFGFSNTTYHFSAERQSIINKFLLIAALSLLLINNTRLCIGNTSMFYQHTQAQIRKFQHIDKKTLLYTNNMSCCTKCTLPDTNKLLLYAKKLPNATSTACTYTPIWQLNINKLLLFTNKTLLFTNTTLPFTSKTLLFTNTTLLFISKLQLPVFEYIYSSNYTSAASGIAPISARIRYLAGGSFSW